MAKSRRANAVVFGFDFQVNAAIVLMIENIEDTLFIRQGDSKLLYWLQVLFHALELFPTYLL